MKNPKKQATFTINTKTLEDLDKFCKSNNMNKSQFIENAIEIAMSHDDEFKKLDILSAKLQVFKEMKLIESNGGSPIFSDAWLLKNILGFSDSEVAIIKKQGSSKI